MPPRSRGSSPSRACVPASARQATPRPSAMFGKTSTRQRSMLISKRWRFGQRADLPQAATLNLFGACPRQTRNRVRASAGTQSHERTACNPGLLPAQEHNTCLNGTSTNLFQGPCAVRTRKRAAPGSSGRAWMPNQFSMTIVIGSASAPVERQRCLANGEAIEMARHGALQAFELPFDTGIDTNIARRLARIEGDGRIRRPVRAARVPGEYDRAVIGVALNREVVLPMLAQLLEIFAGARRRYRGGCGNGHRPDFLTGSRRPGCTVAGGGSASG